jgi:hypothetical protein
MTLKQIRRFMKRILYAGASALVPGLGQGLKGELMRGILTVGISALSTVLSILAGEFSQAVMRGVSLGGVTFFLAQIVDAYGIEILPY